YLVSGTVPGRAGNAHQNIVPYQVFEAADGHVIVAVGNDNQFAKFCDILEQPAWAQDPRFASNAARVRHRELLVPLIAAVIKTQPRQHWLSAMEAAKVPCGPINNLAEAFADPHVQAREMTVAMPHPLSEQLRLVASPIKLSATPVRYRHAPPLLGQHSHELLREAGLDEGQIQALLAAKVVA
ncbi:MAG: CoA transferase, partial [Burkholderiaceae bacterium]|nr:CoA transferase [Burkholderiaceae bacterium]